MDYMINYWAHMLDEAEGGSAGGEFIDNKQHIGDMIEFGLPRNIKEYDIFEYSENGHPAIIFACYRDWPAQGLVCVTGGFIFYNGKWRSIGRSGGIQKYKNTIQEAMRKLIDQYTVWVPIFDKPVCKALNISVFKWEPYFWYKDMLGSTSLLDQKYADGSGFTVMDLARQSTVADIESDDYSMVWLRSDERVDGKIRDILVNRLGLAPQKCKGESYLDVWQKQPGHQLDDICIKLALKIDKKVAKTFGSGFAKKAAEFLAEMRRKDKYWIEYEEYPFDFSKLVDRREWWNLIPDRVYKAIISRAAHPELSRGVSLRVVNDCLDAVCYNLSVLYAQSKRVSTIFKKSRFYAELLFECEKLGLTKYDAGDFMEKILESCGSYVDKNTFKNDSHSGWTGGKFQPLSNTDFATTFAGFFNLLYMIRHDEKNIQFLIAQLSMLVDQAHTRGSLAGAFVEGGAATCDAVSNMKPDELYERKYL